CASGTVVATNYFDYW
nr:immunoglobulin heavy chain junction region [Mus musculus]